jgi:mono/diheme cytochrome c family protein
MPANTPHPRAAGRRVVRISLRIVGAALLLVTVAAATLYGLSERRIRARFEVPDHALRVPTDSAARAEGRHYAITGGCTDCHGQDLGGRVLIDEPLVALITTANLTRGRREPLTDRDWERAVRHGVRRDGSPLMFMPAHELTRMADRELGAIVAYARSLPPVTRALPASTAGPLGRALMLRGSLALVPAERIDHTRAHPAVVVAERTMSYGAYLATGCAGCHGETFAGGPIAGAPPSMPPAANLTPAGRLSAWTERDFVQALRTGRRPDGTRIRPPMPIGATSEMTDVELGALWLYLQSLTPRPTGAR